VVIVKDIFTAESGEVEKEKLVHLYPERLMWTSTHISAQTCFTVHLPDRRRKRRHITIRLHCTAP
jgi:hypothetical protein